MLATSAVVVAIDRLGAGWLGPYGNTWLETPHCNQLAAQSLLCETVIADSPDAARTCRAYWTGRHTLEPEPDTPTLPELAATSGAASCLLTDDPRLAEQPLIGSFQERSCLRRLEASAAAKRIEDTGLYALFEDACQALRGVQRPFLLWIHARGMSGPWDAPLEMRYQFADEDDPRPPEFVEPPERMLAAGYDPDELLGIACAYAGQVALADWCLGMLLEALDEHPLAGETLLAVTSPRGYPLGEHLRVGPCDEALYGEHLQVPLLLRLPRGASALARTQQVVQPHELFAAIAKSCGWPTDRQTVLPLPLGEGGTTRSVVDEGVGNAAGNETPHLNPLPEGEGRTVAGRVACAAAHGQRAIRTPAWFLRESAGKGGPRCELFAKPDDRWEANEISSRCHDIVELLLTELDRFEQAAQSGQLAELPPLDEALAAVWR